jgi:hypothetical protein
MTNLERELLAALKRLVAANSRVMGPQFGPKGADAGVLDAARAAIAKAQTPPATCDNCNVEDWCGKLSCPHAWEWVK